MLMSYRIKCCSMHLLLLSPRAGGSESGRGELASLLRGGATAHTEAARGIARVFQRARRARAAWQGQPLWRGAEGHEQREQNHAESDRQGVLCSAICVRLNATCVRRCVRPLEILARWCSCGVQVTAR